LIPLIEQYDRAKITSRKEILAIRMGTDYFTYRGDAKTLAKVSGFKLTGTIDTWEYKLDYPELEQLSGQAQRRLAIIAAKVDPVIEIPKYEIPEFSMEDFDYLTLDWQEQEIVDKIQERFDKIVEYIWQHFNLDIEVCDLNQLTGLAENEVNIISEAYATVKSSIKERADLSAKEKKEYHTRAESCTLFAQAIIEEISEELWGKLKEYVKVELESKDILWDDGIISDTTYELQQYLFERQYVESTWTRTIRECMEWAIQTINEQNELEAFEIPEYPALNGVLEFPDNTIPDNDTLEVFVSKVEEKKDIIIKHLRFIVIMDGIVVRKVFQINLRNNQRDFVECDLDIEKTANLLKEHVLHVFKNEARTHELLHSPVLEKAQPKRQKKEKAQEDLFDLFGTENG
jgi:hypothetical protein